MSVSDTAGAAGDDVSAAAEQSGDDPLRARAMAEMDKPAYDASSSFFDNISSTATDRMQRPTRREIVEKEKSMNMDTFGTPGYDHNGYRGHGGRRGGYRGGHGHANGGRSYNNNGGGARWNSGGHQWQRGGGSHAHQTQAQSQGFQHSRGFGRGKRVYDATATVRQPQGPPQ